MLRRLSGGQGKFQRLSELVSSIWVHWKTPVLCLKNFLFFVFVALVCLILGCLAPPTCPQVTLFICTFLWTSVSFVHMTEERPNLSTEGCSHGYFVCNAHQYWVVTKANTMTLYVLINMKK